MPLNPTLLQTQLYAGLKAKHSVYFPEVNSQPSQIPNADRMCQWIADGVATPVVTHIISNALVIVNPGIAVQVAFPAGTGSTISPGTGTIT